MKLLVLDGNSLVNRAYFGIKLLTTKDGRYTNAIFGFQNILLNLLAAHKPDAVAIAWDERAPHGFELRVLRPEGEGAWELGADALGHTFSAMAVAPGTRVDLEGMQWPLKDKPMGLLADLGISNVVTSADARAVCRAGALAAFLIK